MERYLVAQSGPGNDPSPTRTALPVRTAGHPAVSSDNERPGTKGHSGASRLRCSRAGERSDMMAVRSHGHPWGMGTVGRFRGLSGGPETFCVLMGDCRCGLSTRLRAGVYLGCEGGFGGPGQAGVLAPHTLALGGRSAERWSLRGAPLSVGHLGALRGIFPSLSSSEFRSVCILLLSYF